MSIHLRGLEFGSNLSLTLLLYSIFGGVTFNAQPKTENAFMLTLLNERRRDARGW